MSRPFIAAAIQAAREAKGLQSKVGKLSREAQEKEELVRQLASLKLELAAAIAERGELRDKVMDLDGGLTEATRLKDEQLAKEKADRVEQLHRQVNALTRQRHYSGAPVECLWAWP